MLFAPPAPSCASSTVTRSPCWKSVPALVGTIADTAPPAAIVISNSASLPNLSVDHKLTLYVPGVLDASACVSNATVSIFDLPNINLDYLLEHSFK